MGMNESYVPVERDKVSASGGAETPMDILNDAAKKRQSGVTASKVQAVQSKGAIIDLAGLAYSFAKYNLVPLKQAENDGKKFAQRFLDDQKKYIETETIQLSKDEILESHKHMRHFSDIPDEQAIDLTSLLVSQFGLAQFIAYTLLKAYHQKILSSDDFFEAAEFFTYLSYLKNLDPIKQQDVTFDKEIYDIFMKKDKKFIDRFRTQDKFIRFVYTLKISVSADYKSFAFRDVPFAEVQEKFGNLLKKETKKNTALKKFMK
jgi:hypothetical protein